MKKRLLPCKNCGFEVAIRSKGLCPGCRARSRPKKSHQSLTQKTPNRNFFQEQIRITTTNTEDGTRIPNPTTINICHILPKRERGFPSMAHDPKNIVNLNWQQHSRFDTLLDERRYSVLEDEFPNTWAVVTKRLPYLLKTAVERNKQYYSLKEYIDGTWTTNNSVQ